MSHVTDTGQKENRKLWSFAVDCIQCKLEMDLSKCTIAVLCSFVAWTITLMTCLISPAEMSGDVAVKLPGAVIPVSKANSLEFFYSLSLSSFPEDLEVNEYCIELLRIYGQRYVTFANCLVFYARPVKVCQNCYTGFKGLKEIYLNISSGQGPGNVSCHDSLTRSDRLMLLYTLYSNLEDIWTSAKCDQCLTEHEEALTNDTRYFMATLNQSLSCFEQYKDNHSELCKDCKPRYKRLNELYGKMEKNQTLCIDIEDAMNITRKLWSKNFGCSFPREETVPVIAVSSFMLFLPIIFYLSSFLHSEQKKRKLIHPKRAKSSSSLMNIQDKFS